MTFGRIGLILLLAQAAISAADWNAKQAAAYLDERQKEWTAWAPAQLAPGEACLSCHTGMTYLLARPALRAMLNETEPTAYEASVLRGLKKRAAKMTGGEMAARYEKEPRASQSIGVEAVLAAFLLSREDVGKPTLSPETAQAFERLWKLQKKEGDRKGAWSWFELNDDPYEGDASPFFGAALAAVAVGNTPPEYRKTVEQPVAALREYLKANPREQHVALRIAEIYEKDLNNPLAAALEYEEVLQKKLQPERWAWAAIHLCNLYGRLNLHQKSVPLLQRIVSEYGNTAAAEKARKRLEELGLTPEAAPAIAEAAPEPETAGQPKLPPGFTLKKT